MSTKSESLASSPAFDTREVVPDGFAVGVMLIILVIAVTLFVIMRPARELIFKFVGVKPNSLSKDAGIDRVRLSARTTLYRVKLDQQEVFVVESSLNTAISLVRGGVNKEEAAASHADKTGEIEK